MRVHSRPVLTGVAVVLGAATAASLALDLGRVPRGGGLDPIAATADPCGAADCTIAFKASIDGAPSRVVPPRRASAAPAEDVVEAGLLVGAERHFGR